MRTLVFCYGTLCDPRLAARIIGHTVPSLPARLNGFRRARWRGRSYPGIWPRPDAAVNGQVLQLRHRRDLRRLDHYEGPDYRRHRLRVRSAAGDVMAWVYLPRAGEPAAAGDWDLENFQRTRLRHYLRRAYAWRSGALPPGGS